MTSSDTAHSGPGIRVGPPLDKWPWLADRAFVSGGVWKLALTAGEVAALVAQAFSDGQEDGRGDMEHFERRWRAEERERIAARIDRADEVYPKDHRDRPQPYLDGFADALDLGARLARGPSRPPLPPPNRLLEATADDNPAVPLDGPS